MHHLRIWRLTVHTSNHIQMPASYYIEYISYLIHLVLSRDLNSHISTLWMEVNKHPIIHNGRALHMMPSQARIKGTFIIIITSADRLLFLSY